MKKIIAVLLALVLVAAGLGSLVYALGPNQVEVGFNTHWGHEVTGDIFTNQEVTGGESWSAQMRNTPDETEASVTGLALSLESGLAIDRFEPDPTTPAPGTYEWSFGEVLQESEVAASAHPSEPEVTFTPGFHVFRSADITRFSISQVMQLQTLTITLTPLITTEKFSINVKIPESELVDAVITSPTSGEGIYLSPDGQGLDIQIQPTDLQLENPWTTTVTIQVTPQIDAVEFVPSVTAIWHEEIAASTTTESPVSGPAGHPAYPAGTWTWSADGSYEWHWSHVVSRHISLSGYSKADEVYVNFNTNYYHSLSGDNFANTEVMGNMHWSTNLDRKDAMSPVTNVSLNLESSLEFGWIDPTPSTMNPPIYGWLFGDIAPESGVWVTVGPGDIPSPLVPFTPGFDASRLVDKTNFIAPGTQNLTITVTPKHSMDYLHIGVEVLEDENVIPIITSPTTDEEQGIFLWEGQKLHIEIHNAEAGDIYIYNVVIEVTPKVPEVEFMPHINICAGDNITSSSTSGSSLPYTVSDLGTWTWSATSNHIWLWRENERRYVDFQGYSNAIVEPIPHVPMIGQKLVGQGVFGFMPMDGDSNTTFSTTFVFTNPDCVREITIERISIFRMDGTVAYEGQLLDGMTPILKPHETRTIDLMMYVSPQEPPTFYTVEIFWSEAKKGLPLTGWIYVITFVQDAEGNMEIKTLSQTQMVNMEQALEPVKEGKPK